MGPALFLLSPVKAGPFFPPPIPAKAVTQAVSWTAAESAWIQAFAGMVGEGIG